MSSNVVHIPKGYSLTLTADALSSGIYVRDADGTAIATAVNSILGILVAAGLMAAPE